MVYFKKGGDADFLKVLPSQMELRLYPLPQYCLLFHIELAYLVFKVKLLSPLFPTIKG